MEHRPGHSQQFDPAEEELVIFNRESPFSLEDDDPRVDRHYLELHVIFYLCIP